MSVKPMIPATVNPPPTPRDRRTFLEGLGDGEAQLFAQHHELFDQAAAGDPRARDELNRALKAWKLANRPEQNARGREFNQLRPVVGGSESERRIDEAI